MGNNLDQRRITYESYLQHSYMVVKLYNEDMVQEYQVRMIQENPSRQLLPMHKKQMDHDVLLFYDITSMISLQQLLKRRKLMRYDFMTILMSLLKALSLSKEYLLKEGGFILQSEYIYIDPASLEISLAYLPVDIGANLDEEIRSLLMDVLIYKASFETPAEGDFVYELLSVLKGENFCLGLLNQVITGLMLQRRDKQGADKHWETHGEKEGLKPKIESSKALANQKGTKWSPKNLNSTFILLQLCFFALTALLARYVYVQHSTWEPSKLLGILIIAGSLDALIINKLGLIKQKSIQKPLEKSRKNKPNSGVSSLISKKAVKPIHPEPAPADKEQDVINPRDMETRMMLEDRTANAYFIGFGANENEKIIIDRQSFVIGRMKGTVDYASVNSAVGKLHAEIVKKQDGFYLIDLNSRNGTYINGERIISNVEHLIQSNDRIAFANSEYKFICS